MNNKTRLTPCGNYTGQFWSLAPLGDDKYRMTTEFRGPNMCLDVVNGGRDNNDTQLTSCGNYSGQIWTVRPTRIGVQ
jgi:hypothetical protein